jgi:hypothetical protein
VGHLSHENWHRVRLRRQLQRLDLKPRHLGYLGQRGHLRPSGDFISYYNLAAKNFAKFSDGVIQVGSATTNLDNCKRMELKAYDLYTGVYLDYRYDWACVYRQPLDHPVVFVLVNALRNGTDRTIKITHSGVVSQGIGKDTVRVYLPEDKMYPAGAQVALYDASQQLLGQTAISYDGQLDGLFPGDTFKLDTLTASSAERREMFTSSDLEVFPNPFRQSVTVVFSDVASLKGIRFYDIAGKQVAFFPSAGKGSLTWMPENAVPGIYIVKVGMTKGSLARKIILTH